MLKELFFRLVQHFMGSFIFDAPGLASIKSAALRCFFDLGKNSYVSYHTVFVAPHIRQVTPLKIGDNVAIEHSCFIDYSGGLIIEDDVWISEGVFIGTHGHVIRSRALKKKQDINYSPLVIAEDAWIGAGAVILDKVSRIGRGAVIGAGAVVTKDVADWSIVAGNPARVIGSRIENQLDID